MTINARSEMDLEEDTIKDKVSKASGNPFLFPPSPSYAVVDISSLPP